MDNLDELQQVLNELYNHFREIAHLSLDEQLRKFDEPLNILERKIADCEKICLGEMSEYSIMKQLARAIINYPKEQAKAMFINLINIALNQCIANEIYLSVLQNKFPSERRISSLVQKYNNSSQHFKRLVKIVGNY